MVYMQKNSAETVDAAINGTWHEHRAFTFSLIQSWWQIAL
jgi:hypothetical protein